MTCCCCYLRAAADLASATYAQTEKKVDADLANMKKYIGDAQDHANRQAFRPSMSIGQAVIFVSQATPCHQSRRLRIHVCHLSLVGAGSAGRQIFDLEV